MGNAPLVWASLSAYTPVMTFAVEYSPNTERIADFHLVTFDALGNIVGIYQARCVIQISLSCTFDSCLVHQV